jgi:hypothetical protein
MADVDRFEAKPNLLPGKRVCGPITMNPGGGALVLNVGTNDGPGSFEIISHRSCLADCLHLDSSGERARALKIGFMSRPRN